LKPGGWIELCDTISPLTCDDGTMPPDCPLLKWNKLLLEASVKLGATLDCALHYKERMEAVGFTNVTEVHYKWPTNSLWPKDPKYKAIGNIRKHLNYISL